MESSWEAFQNQIARDYGLEFDVRVTRDGGLVVIHDGNLSRATGGADMREIKDVDLAEILSMDFHGSHLATFAQVLELVTTRQRPGAVSAVHLKIGSQTPAALELIEAELKKADPTKFWVFDVTIDTARFLKGRNPSLQLAPSVAHPYDIARYNSAVGGTLLSVEEVLANRELFSAVWLDEWDTADEGGGHKQFYTRETFDTFRAAGLLIGLVTPELHASSPGLLGGEAHADAKDHETLMARIKEIVALHPDAVCTDYPDEVQQLLAHA